MALDEPRTGVYVWVLVESTSVMYEIGIVHRFGLLTSYAHLTVVTSILNPKGRANVSILNLARAHSYL